MNLYPGASEAPLPTPPARHRASFSPPSPAPSSLSSSPDAPSVLLPHPRLAVRARPPDPARGPALDDALRLSLSAPTCDSTPDTSVRSSLTLSDSPSPSTLTLKPLSFSPDPCATPPTSPARLRPAWLSDERRKSNRVSVGRRVRVIAPDFEPEAVANPHTAHTDERRSLFDMSKARWRGYGTLLLDMDSGPAAGGISDPRWAMQEDKYLRRRALSVLGTGALFLLLTLFLLCELFWLKVPPIEQIITPRPYALPPSYNATVVRAVPFSAPQLSPSVSSGGADPKFDGPSPLIPKTDWWIQASYEFYPPGNVMTSDESVDTFLLFHSVGVRHRGHVHVHTASEPVGSHEGDGSNEEDDEVYISSIARDEDMSSPRCDPGPRATAQLYAFGPHRDQLVSSLALAEVRTAEGRLGLTLASDVTPWFDARNAINVHVELTLHPPQTCSVPMPSPSPEPEPNSVPARGLSSAQSRRDASSSSTASHSMLAIDIASSRLGVTFHGTPQDPATLERQKSSLSNQDVALRSLRLSSYYGAINLVGSVRVWDQVWAQTWFGPLTSTGALFAPDAEVLLHAPYGQMTLGHVQAASAKVTSGVSNLHIAHLQASFIDISATLGRIDVALKPTGPVYLHTHEGEIDADIDLDLLVLPPPLDPPSEGSSRQSSVERELGDQGGVSLASDMRLASRTGRITARYRGQAPDVPLHSHVMSGGAISVTHPAMFQGHFNLSADTPAAVSAPLSKQWRLDPVSARANTTDSFECERARQAGDVAPPPGRAPRETAKFNAKPKARKPIVGRTWLAGRSPYGLDEPGWGKSIVLGAREPVIIAL